MTTVDNLRRKIEGKAYPLDNETCSLLLDVAKELDRSLPYLFNSPLDGSLDRYEASAEALRHLENHV